MSEIIATERIQTEERNIKTETDRQIFGRRGPGRLKKIWIPTTVGGIRNMKLRLILHGS